MSAEWREEPFQSIIDFQEGPGILAKDFRDAGVPLVRLSGLDRGGSVLAGCNYLDPDAVTKKWAHFGLAKGDILLSTSASLGRIAVVGEDGVGAIPYTGIIRMRPRDSRLVAKFIRYLLEGPDFQRQAEMVGAGSVIRHFGPMHLRQMTVRVPPADQQRAIAHILGTLDDKIELNRRMSETLEAMARALFKSWFVDFDPVRAKAEGRDPGLPKPLADLFPSRLVGSDLGEIPEGWKTGPILDHARLMSGGTPKTDRPEYWNGSIAWASAKDVSQSPESFLITTERTITERGLNESATQMVPAFCSVVVARGATTGRMVLLGGDMAMNQTCYALASSSDTPFTLYCQLRVAIDALVHAAHGSAFDTITTSTFTSSRIVLPPKAVLKAFEERTTPLFLRVLESTCETRTLANLRDALLPQLISGNIRIKEVDKFIGRDA